MEEKMIKWRARPRCEGIEEELKDDLLTGWRRYTDSISDEGWQMETQVNTREKRWRNINSNEVVHNDPVPYEEHQRVNDSLEKEAKKLQDKNKKGTRKKKGMISVHEIYTILKKSLS